MYVFLLLRAGGGGLYVLLKACVYFWTSMVLVRFLGFALCLGWDLVLLV